MPPKNLLVTGATGHQGSALINALLALPSHQTLFHIYALTRHPTSPSALRLAARGITVITGDLNSPAAALSQIPKPIYGVFLVTVPGADELQQGLATIDAATAAGVQYFVYSSADRGGAGATEGENVTGIRHFGVKREIEIYLKNACAISAQDRGVAGMEWTILRPTSFMENLAPGVVGKLTFTMFAQMGRTRLSLISTEDIGRAAGMVFTDTAGKYAGRALTLTGDILTFEEANMIFREELGKDAPRTWEWVVNGLQWAIRDLGDTMRFFREGGGDYEMDRGLKEELGLKDFREWLKEDSGYL